jgi:electron transport complex protein RnfG
MVGIGVFCALLIVLTYEGTLPRVTHLKAEALEKAIFKVVPGTPNKISIGRQQSGLFRPMLRTKRQRWFTRATMRGRIAG